jgi:uncharacterized phage protein (TIGR01671 family)
MNRKIKFRAKPKNPAEYGEWVHGYYTQDLCGGEMRHFIFDCPMAIEVLGETVGQFTGFRDKDGKEIYEGDILSLITEDGIKINFVCVFGSAHIIVDTGYLCDIVGFYFEHSDGRKSFPVVYNYKGLHDAEIMEVIGNIHDNKDLLTTK